MPARPTPLSRAPYLTGRFQLSEHREDLRRIGVALLGDRRRAEPISGLAQNHLQLLYRQRVQLLSSPARLDRHRPWLRNGGLGRAIGQRPPRVLDPGDLRPQILQAALNRFVKLLDECHYTMI